MPPGATRAEVTAAFRRFALRNHPDRGGDPELFRTGAEAYRGLLNRARSTTTAAVSRADVVFHRRRHGALGALLRRAHLTATRPRS